MILLRTPPGSPSSSAWIADKAKLDAFSIKSEADTVDLLAGKHLVAVDAEDVILRPMITDMLKKIRT
jgi:hypothetical protein